MEEDRSTNSSDHGSEMDLGGMAILLDSSSSDTSRHQASNSTSLAPMSRGASSALRGGSSEDSGVRGSQPCAVASGGVIKQQPLASARLQHGAAQDVVDRPESPARKGSKDTDWFWNWTTSTAAAALATATTSARPVATLSADQNGGEASGVRVRSHSTPVPAVEQASSSVNRLSFSPPPSLSSETVPGQPERLTGSTGVDGSGRLSYTSSSLSDRDSDNTNSGSAPPSGVYPPLHTAAMPIPVLVPAPRASDRGLTMSTNSSIRHSTPENEDEDTRTSVALVPSSVFADFVKCRQCFILMPDNSKMVIFDAHLLVKKAFFALVQNGVRSAPVWDGVTQSFIGMLTITDFINILRHYYRSPLVQMHELEEHRIQTWRDLAIKRCHEVLVSIDPLQSLYDAVRMLIEKKIHRLPVIDPRTANCLFILTPKRLLQYLHVEFDNLPQPEFLSSSISSLNIGTYNNIATVSQDTALIVILNIFSERRISAVPVIDHNGQVVEVYAKFDVINLAAYKTYNNLDISVKDALNHRADSSRSVHTCLPSESLRTVIRRIVEKQVHRLIVVDTGNHVVGIISLSDILSFLVLQAPDLFQ